MDPTLLAQLMEMLGNDPATLPSFMSQMRANYQKYQGPPKNGGDSIEQQIIKAKEVFRRERMLPPSPAPPPTPRAILQLLFEQERCKMLKRESSGDSHTQTYLRSSYIGAPIDFSRAPLSSLTRIRIRDMMVRKRHLVSISHLGVHRAITLDLYFRAIIFLEGL
ncbi:hypothetical protein FRC03_004374 [Tulasnella sp. 419]|nr:hypothetical protein FRC03_004374 [Tulasnella sp. 419]